MQLDSCPVCLQPLKEEEEGKGFASLERMHQVPVIREGVVKKLGPCPEGEMSVRMNEK